MYRFMTRSFVLEANFAWKLEQTERVLGIGYISRGIYIF